MKLLNASQQQQVLQWMRKELVERDKAFAKVRDKSAAQKKAEDLKRRIFTRDRMERDSSVVAGRIFDKRPDGRRKIATGEGKSLGQLVDEEIKRTKPSLANKYNAKYRKAVYAAIAANPAKMGEVAGALSAGDYQTVVDNAADWGAQGFGAIVGDVLKEKNMDDAKVVWDRAVKHADAARRVILALKKGGSGDEAMKIIKDEWKKEVKTQSRAFMKAAVNFAFNASKYDRKLGGAATIGDFIPSGTARNLIAPSLSGLTPGDLYLKLVDSELALIKWGDEFLRTKWSGGDGACIAKYKEEHERTGNVADAYEAYDHCSSTAKYSAMFKFGVHAEEIGLDKTAALKEFLEANRRGLRGSSTPLDWIKTKAERIAAQQKEAGRAIEAQLTAMNADLSGMAQGIGTLMDDRLTELAGSVLDDKQWDRIAAQLRDLEKKLDETLAAIDADLNKADTVSSQIKNYCEQYDRQKGVARQATGEARLMSVRASRLRAKLESIDTISCGPLKPASDASNSAAKLAALAAAAAKDRAALRAATDAVCAAPEDIRNAKNKAEGRARPHAALESAREAKAIAQRLTAGTGEIASLKAKAGDADAATPASATAARAKAQAELAAARSEIDAIAGGFGSAQERFTVAHNAMREAQQHVFNFQKPIQETIDDIKTCLRPLAASPAGETPRAILAGLLTKSEANVGCNADIQDSWNVRDIDPPGADGAPSNSAPWRTRSLALLPPPDTLRALAAEIDAKCPAGAAQPAPSASPAPSQQADPDAIKAETAEALARMERCAAQALVAYRDAWIKSQVTMPALTCRPLQYPDLLAKLRADGSDEAKEQIAKLEPIAAAVSQAHRIYGLSRQAYNKGDLDIARNALNNAKAALAPLGGNPDCSELSQKIANEMARVERLDGAMSEVNAAIGRCDSTEVARLKDRYASISHLMLTSLFTKSEAITDAKLSYERAKASYAAGDLNAAESTTRRALASLGGVACADLRERLTNAQNRIDRLRTAIDNANQAILACKISSIEQWRRALATVSNPAASGVKQRLERVLPSCRDREKIEKIADMDKRCKVMLGVNSHIDRARALSSSPLCLCNDGYVMDAAKSVCVERPKTVADGHPVCKQNFGSRAYALTVNPNGTYQCGCTGGYVIRNKRCSRPTVADGHPVCQQNFGPRAYAVAANRNGTYRCGCTGGYVMRNNRCLPPTLADGHRACQAQFGVRSRATGYAGNGRWNCFTPRVVHRPPPVRRPPTVYRPPHQPAPSSRVASCGFPKACDYSRCNATEMARWRKFLACKRTGGR
ncbi:MAG: hypothetical protein K9G60_10885 [Pseudolabrys sp.]|nr:hypothetical protein [Pseudolabrys sp.]